MKQWQILFIKTNNIIDFNQISPADLFPKQTQPALDINIINPICNRTSCLICCSAVSLMKQTNSSRQDMKQRVKSERSCSQIRSQSCSQRATDVKIGGGGLRGRRDKETRRRCSCDTQSSLWHTLSLWALFQVQNRPVLSAPTPNTQLTLRHALTHKVDL